MKDKKDKPLISLDDLTPREEVRGGVDKGKQIFGSFNSQNDKNKPKDRF